MVPTNFVTRREVEDMIDLRVNKAFESYDTLKMLPRHKENADKIDMIEEKVNTMNNQLSKWGGVATAAMIGLQIVFHFWK